jgi:hypothetical protein
MQERTNAKDPCDVRNDKQVDKDIEKVIGKLCGLYHTRQLPKDNYFEKYIAENIEVTLPGKPPITIRGRQKFFDEVYKQYGMFKDMEVIELSVTPMDAASPAKGAKANYLFKYTTDHDGKPHDDKIEAYWTFTNQEGGEMKWKLLTAKYECPTCKY